MVVADSSALIPLSWVSRLDLISATFDEIHTVEAVREEVLTGGRRGTAALRDFLDDAVVQPTPSDAEEVAELEGIAVADAAVLLVARAEGDILLANDKALIEVARSQGVDCWWVTTLLLEATRAGTLTASDSVDVLFSLVDEGMNLHPRVYARVQRALEELGE